MAAASVASTAGRVAVTNGLSAIKITVTASTTAYATSTGGLPFDLFATLKNASPSPAELINYNDIIGFIPLGLTTGKFELSGFAVGTASVSTLPCTIRIFTSGATAQAALVEISDANLTDAFTGLLLVSRGGNN